MNCLYFLLVSSWMLFSTNLLGARQGYVIDTAKTYFAIVTGKEGLARAAAHEHVVVAKNYEANLSIDEQDPTKSSFNLAISTAKLVIDNPDDQKAVYNILKKLKLRDAKFPKLDAKELKDVRESMLSKEQLDVKNFNKITVRIAKITNNKASNDYKIKFIMKVKNKTVTKFMNVKVSHDKNLLKINGHTKIKFSDFGIKPYSAFLGVVKVSDEFLMVLDLTAKRH
jgi:polyisoprenoid-binding protein YceI